MKFVASSCRPGKANSDAASVSAGNSSMGQEALLALLEARVTDLCAQLDTINPELRDSIFLVIIRIMFIKTKFTKRVAEVSP